MLPGSPQISRCALRLTLAVFALYQVLMAAEQLILAVAGCTAVKLPDTYLEEVRDGISTTKPKMSSGLQHADEMDDAI